MRIYRHPFYILSIPFFILTLFILNYPLQAQTSTTNEVYSAQSRQSNDFAAEDAVRQALMQAQAAEGYQFSSHIKQVAIPNAAPHMLGQTSLQIEMEIDGITSSDKQSEMTLWVHGLDLNKTLHLLQDGENLFVRNGNDLVPVENQIGMIPVGNDYLGFLAGAENITSLPSKTIVGEEISTLSIPA